jgi:hypothetical protein
MNLQIGQTKFESISFSGIIDENWFDEVIVPVLIRRSLNIG